MGIAVGDEGSDADCDSGLPPAPPLKLYGARSESACFYRAECVV